METRIPLPPLAHLEDPDPDLPELQVDGVGKGGPGSSVQEGVSVFSSRLASFSLLLSSTSIPLSFSVPYRPTFPSFVSFFFFLIFPWAFVLFSRRVSFGFTLALVLWFFRSLSSSLSFWVASFPFSGYAFMCLPLSYFIYFPFFSSLWSLGIFLLSSIVHLPHILFSLSPSLSLL